MRRDVGQKFQYDGSMKLFLLFILISFNSVQATSYSKSDHYDGERFFNPGLNLDKNFFDFLKWQLDGEGKDWPEHVANVVHPLPRFQGNTRALFTFINHATYLVQVAGVNFLTDPVFSQRVSPVSFAGPKRVKDPGVMLESLPAIQVVLISHNHYDHMDLESLKAIDAKFHPLFLVPLGEEKRLKQTGIQNVVELDWWQSFKVKDVTITFTRVQHWSNRTPWDKFKSLWGGYMVSAPATKFYFGGDTGYSDHFKETFKRLGAPDVALIPIGAYEPRWFMQLQHLNPEEAVRAHLELKAGMSLPMHFGTFQLSNEAYDDPVKELKKALKKYQVDPEKFPVLDQGQTLTF